jgi:hypothetical protein
MHMSNWAIVIGVDQYPASPTWSLNGAVRDALKMRDWLLDTRGGSVPPENLILLLGPHAPIADSSIKYNPPSLIGIVTAIEKVLTDSEGVTDRFYFYFSGHGLSARVDFSTQQAIVASDFSVIVPTMSLTVLSLFELFLSTHFAEQYFFIDACRNMPFDEVRLGEYPKPRSPVSPASAQFVMYATQPGVKAREVGKPGDETGAFTDALLNGLNGKGAAKTWDQDNDEYVIRWSRLFAMVEDTLRKRKLLADAQPGGPLIQIPKQFGERGSADPEMGRFPPDKFSPEGLFINLAPAERVATLAELWVNEMRGSAANCAPPHTSLPISVLLPPRAYSVYGSADGYRSKKPSITVELYEQSTVTVEFVESSPGPLWPPPENLPPVASRAGTGLLTSGVDRNIRTPDWGDRVLAGFRIEDTPSRSSIVSLPQDLGHLNVVTSDPLVLIRVADESGKVVATSRGKIHLAGLAYGYYRVSTLSPEGDVVAESLEQPRAHASSSIDLSLANQLSPAMEQIVAWAKFEVGSDGVISPSEAVGPTEFLKLSTVLALAAGASLEGQSASYGVRLRTLPVATFTDDSNKRICNGLYVVLGDEFTKEYWLEAAVGVRSTKYGDTSIKKLDVHAGALSGEVTIRSVVKELDPGSYRLLLSLPTTSIEIPFVILLNRATIISCTRELDNTVEIHQYLMPTATPASMDSGVPRSQARDPFFGATNFAAIRRIEYMQRSFAKGRLTPLAPDVDLLLQGKWLDPIAGCLGAYIAIRTGHERKLGTATANLVKYFGALPDAHVLRGRHLEAMGDYDGALNHYEQSLASGVLPLFRDGLLILAGAAKKLPLPSRLQAETDLLLAQTLSGGTWSVVVTGTPPEHDAQVEDAQNPNAIEINESSVVSTAAS